MIGPIYPTSGLAYAFPKGSPLVSEVSREILKLKQSEKMVRMSKDWLEDEKSCPDADGALSTSQSLSVDSFKGLFLIAGLSSTIALAIFLSTFLYENWHVLSSPASTKERILGLARIFSRGKGEVSSYKESRSPEDGGRVSGGSPAISIACNEEEMFSQDEGFSTVEITPIQPNTGG